MKTRPTFFKFLIVAGLFAALASFTACQKGSSGGVLTLPQGTATGVATGVATTGSGTGSITGVGTTGTGSGTGSSTPTSDQLAALNAALGAAGQITPGQSGLSPELLAELKQLLSQESQGQNVSPQLLALAGKMLQQCSAKAATLAPIPGQPLLGEWNGGGKCAVQFTVAGSGAGGKYTVSGTTNGTMQADTAGNGAINAQPFSGNVKDNPVSGNGTLTNPSFFKTKAGKKPCYVAVQLTGPTSPIPANYQEAMKEAGQCFRQALILMSPTFSQMFQGMDPALASQIQSKFLGISQ